jgi:hypothetical protein
VTRGLDLFDPHSPGHAAFVEAVGFVVGVLDPQRSVLFMQDGGSAPRSRARHPPAGEH